MRRLFSFILLAGLLSGCGGGGGGGSGDSAPVNNGSDSEPEPIEILLLDSVPSSGAPAIDAGGITFNFSHPAHSDLSINVGGDCADLQAGTLRRSLLDLTGNEFNELLEHYVSCSVEENTSYKIVADGTRSNDEALQASLDFSTGNRMTSSATVQD